MWGYRKEDNDIDFVAALNPVLNRGETSRQTCRDFRQTGAIAAITTQCENVEAACAFPDFACTRKSWELYNYGSYGDVHLINQEGLPCFPTDGLMYNDPENQRLSNLIWKYRLHDVADIRDYWTTNMDSPVAMPPVLPGSCTVSPAASAQGDPGDE